jgi:transposase
MLIIGCDYHPSFQQNAWVDTGSGECGEQQLQHSNGEAEKFYRDLKLRGMQVRVGMEATGHARWFERLLAELQYELWVGDPAQIKAARVRKQKTDRRDAGHILKVDGGRSLSAGVGAGVRRIGICANCSGIGIGWCRCGRGS